MVASPPLKTRQRLLVTASRIFAEKGYQDATIAEICDQAETNIASVNYHFGDKKNLYLESWRYAFQQDLQTHPSDGGVKAETSPQERLGGRIKSLIARIADPNSYFFAIIHKEMAQQTSLLAKILEQEINPERRIMKALIRELLGPNATEQHIQFCHASIIGQCFHLLNIKHIKLDPKTKQEVLNLADADAYAEHVVTFTLAGIEALRQQISEHSDDA